MPFPSSVNGLRHTISQGCVKSIRGNTLHPPIKDAEIDLAVLRVESEVAQEDFDKNQKERGQQKPITPQSPAYQSPLVRRDNEDDE